MPEMHKAHRENAPPVFFEYGFRPFFLGAGISALLTMLAWLLWIGLHAASIDIVLVTVAGPLYQWHAHEMIFGYGLAVVAGFFLTAVPNWTGRRPVAGRLLAVLFGLWVTARLTSWISAALPPLVVALPELGFVGMLATLVGQALLSGWSKRNFVFLPVLAAIFAGALLYHLERAGLVEDVAGTGAILGLDALLLLIAVIGGRIVPAFTTNALRREGDANLPRAMNRLDMAAIAAVAALAVADLAAPGTQATGAIALVAGLLNGVRMIGWRTGRVLGAPILWILHLAYGWLAAGLVLKGLALTTGALSEITAIHAFTIGTVGSMTLGVMTRAALGHTGRLLHVAKPIVASYVLVSLAAGLRIAGPAFLPEYYNEAMLISGAFWCVAYFLFVLIYWPILTQPRISAHH